MKLKERVIKNIISHISLLLVFVFSFSLPMFSYDEISSEQRSSIIKTLTTDSNPWKKVSISGKLKMKGLPVSANVKIYMEKDNLVIISLSALIVGEVGRCEITRDSITLINKMKKVYVQESIQKFIEFYPVELRQLQDLILGKPVFPGVDVSDMNKKEWIEVLGQAEEYAVLPGEKARLDVCDYGYVIDPQGRLKEMAVIPSVATDSYAKIDYSYQKKGYSLACSYKTGIKTFKGNLELDQPLYGQGNLSPMMINSKYEKVTIERFLSLF